MKIYLYLTDKMEVYFLPKDISGSNSFDPDENENSMLININAVNHKWMLYSTKESVVTYNDKIEKMSPPPESDGDKEFKEKLEDFFESLN